jgi:hypothetical protein
MAENTKKCKVYLDFAKLIFINNMFPEKTDERQISCNQTDNKDMMLGSEKLWNEIIKKNKKYYERDGYLNIEYLSDKKLYRRKPFTKGRPKKVSIKQKRITIRMDEEVSNILNSYCQTNNISESEAIRRAIMTLK